MAIDLNRRNSFAHAFVMYPQILEKYVTENCALKDSVGERYIGAMPRVTQMSVMRYFMAQFIFRLVNTRARYDGELESVPLREFTKEAQARLMEYRRIMLLGFENGTQITAPDKYVKAMQQIEHNMATIIFGALAQEVQIQEDCEELAKVKGESPPRPFNEGDFWHDVFLALTMLNTVKGVGWRRPIEVIVLDHMPAFRKALVADLTPVEQIEVPAQETVH